MNFRHYLFSVLTLCSIGLLHQNINAQVLHIKNKSEFDAKIAKGSSVVKFSASWCGPCKRYAPTFEKVSNQIQDIAFIGVDTEQGSAIAQQFSVRSIPTTILFKDGKEVKRETGCMSDKELKKFIGR